MSSGWLSGYWSLSRQSILGRAWRRAFTQEEIEASLKVADAEWRGLILFGLYTVQRL